jgi:hypothetical protein
MSSSVRRRCDRAHPVAVPAISLVYRYPAIRPRTYVVLSSGGANSGHADFFAAWHERGLRDLVHDCLNALKEC